MCNLNHALCFGQTARLYCALKLRYEGLTSLILKSNSPFSSATKRRLGFSNTDRESIHMDFRQYWAAFSWFAKFATAKIVTIEK